MDVPSVFTVTNTLITSFPLFRALNFIDINDIFPGASQMKPPCVLFANMSKMGSGYFDRFMIYVLDSR